MNEEVGKMLGTILVLLIYALVIFTADCIKKKRSLRKERKLKSIKSNYNIGWRESQGK